MKNKFNDKIRLMLTISIFVLFIAIGFTGVIGQSLSNVNSVEEKQIEYTQTKSSQPLALFDFFYKIFNNDWNYWSNSPNMYSIASGNVGIGITNPVEKLDVAGTIKMTGFNMPTGANNGYVLTSDGTGRGSWQYISASDGHSLDAVDGDPQNVVFVNEDGTVTINTLGTFFGNLGEGNKKTANVNIETEGIMSTTVGSDSTTSVTNNMNVAVGNNLDVSVGGAANIQVGSNLDVGADGDTTITSGKSLTITSGISTTIVGPVTIDGKLTVTGGIDPPYMSFSKESRESIREYAEDVDEHEEVMQFWNGDFHRMEVYVISEDTFYTITGEMIEE
ncbi:MAG: hypothetical protein JSU91_00530 [Thermoplasmatales archaeon]|nr:MAG: hypothetical protein JSU91_00530 [Thermoplasmatales archaeon]